MSSYADEAEGGGAEEDEREDQRQEEMIPWSCVDMDIRWKLIKLLNPWPNDNGWVALATVLDRSFDSPDIRFIESLEKVHAQVFFDKYDERCDASYNEIRQGLRNLGRVDCLKVLHNHHDRIMQKFKTRKEQMSQPQTCNVKACGEGCVSSTSQHNMCRFISFPQSMCCQDKNSKHMCNLSSSSLHMHNHRSASQHMCSSTSASQHMCSSTSAPQHMCSSTSSPQHMCSSTSAPQHMCSSTSAPQHMFGSSSAPQPVHNPGTNSVSESEPPCFNHGHFCSILSQFSTGCLSLSSQCMLSNSLTSGSHPSTSRSCCHTHSNWPTGFNCSHSVLDANQTAPKSCCYLHPCPDSRLNAAIPHFPTPPGGTNTQWNRSVSSQSEGLSVSSSSSTLSQYYDAQEFLPLPQEAIAPPPDMIKVKKMMSVSKKPTPYQQSHELQMSTAQHQKIKSKKHQRKMWRDNVSSNSAVTVSSSSSSSDQSGTPSLEDQQSSMSKGLSHVPMLSVRNSPSELRKPPTDASCTETGIKVFITYSRDGKVHEKEMKKLILLLSNNIQFTVYIDEPTLARTKMEESIEEMYQAAFRAADFVLVCISPKYLEDISTTPSSSSSAEYNRPVIHTFDIYQMMKQEHLQRNRLAVSKKLHTKSRFVSLMFGNLSPDQMPDWLHKHYPVFKCPSDIENIIKYLQKPKENFSNQIVTEVYI